MEQDSKLNGLQSRTVTLENKTEQKVSTDMNIKKLNMFSSDVLEKAKITQPIQQNVQNTTITPENSQKLERIKEHIKASHYGTYSTNEKIEEVPQQEEQTVEQNEETEEQIDSLYATSLTLESTNDENLEKEINSYSKTETKSYKFRFRLLTGVFCCLLALLGGWIIGNVIEIASTNSQITSATEYSVNLKDLITNISRTDQEDTPSSPSDGSLIPIEEIIPITPQPLENPTDYEEESNWFDKICNWLNNVFGG